jgi:hypothetical protein
VVSYHYSGANNVTQLVDMPLTSKIEAYHALHARKAYVRPAKVAKPLRRGYSWPCAHPIEIIGQIDAYV